MELVTVSDPWAESLAMLSRYYVGGATLQETLEKVSQIALETVGVADQVGITMVVEGQQRTAICTDPEMREIDQAQYDKGQGPCVQAMRDGEVQQIGSTAADDRYPEFCKAALAHGILSTLSLPMVVQGGPAGAMNFYARQENAFPPDIARRAEPFAAQAAIALANAQVYWDATQLSARLTDAINYRGIIEQAKGMLMAAQRCSADEAHQLLIAASQRENLKVRAIAQRIVDENTNDLA